MRRKIEVLTGISNEFFGEWERLWRTSKSGHFFNSPSWFLACDDAGLCNGYKIYTQWRDDKLEVVLPLAPQKKFGIATLMSPGDMFLDKSSILLADDVSSLALLQKRLVLDQPFSLNELSQEQCNFFQREDGIRLKEASINPYILLSGDPFVGVSKKQKSKIRNKIMKNKQHLSYVSYKSDQKALDVVFSIEERSYKKMKGKATFFCQQNRNFLRYIMLRNRGRVAIDVLSYDDVPFICGIGFYSKKTYHAFYTSYDADYRHLSPGKLLLFYLLQRLKDQGVEVFDFSRGKSTLKSEFTSLARTQYTLSYTTNYMTDLWWKAADKTHESILENQILYGTYCQLKRLFY